MNRIKKILLLWYMKDDNFGDLLISETVRLFLEDQGYLVEDHEVGEPKENIINHANQCDMMLFAGGGIIERYMPEVIREFDYVYQNIRIPYGVMGIGIGKFDYSSYNKQIETWIRKSMFFYVRDDYTRNELNSIAKNNKVVFSADCVFGNKYIKSMKKYYGENVGLNIRDLPYKDITGDFDWNNIKHLIKKIECNDLIMDSSKEIINAFCINNAELKYMQYTKLLPYEKTRFIIQQIEECQYVVAMRFHVILVAAMLGIPCVPIKYCPKVEFLSEQLGIDDVSVDISQFDQIDVKVRELCNHRENYVKKINQNVETLEEKTNKMFDEIKGYLRGDY